MVTILRAMLGAVVVGGLYILSVSLPGPGGAWGLLVLAVIGLIGGTIIRSWWSVGLVPAALFGTVMVWRVITCPGCPPGPDYLASYIAVLVTVALAAALGTAISQVAMRAVGRPAAR